MREQNDQILSEVTVMLRGPLLRWIVLAGLILVLLILSRSVG